MDSLRDNKNQSFVSSQPDPVLFLDIQNLLQTETNFLIDGCSAMVQIFIFVFALILANEQLKEGFIEQIMDLDEEMQECLSTLIQQSSELIDRLSGGGQDESQTEIEIQETSI